MKRGALRGVYDILLSDDKKSYSGTQYRCYNNYSTVPSEKKIAYSRTHTY